MEVISQMAQKKRKIVRAFKIIGRGLLFLIILVSALEIATRIYWKISPDFSPGEDGFDLWRNHPLLGIDFNPGFSARIKLCEHPKGYYVFSINKQGLREDHLVPDKKERLRILVLGDSHTEGAAENSETYPNRVENIISLAEHYSCEVLNAGVGGYGPLEEYLWLKIYSPRYDPDIIIIGFYLGNDLGEIMRSSSFFPKLQKVDSRYLIIPPQEGCCPKLARYSSLYALVYWAICLKENVQKGPMVQSGLGGRETDEAYARVSYIFDLFNEKANEMNANLLVVLIPTKLQIEGLENCQILKKAIKEMGLDDTDINYIDRVRDRMIMMLKDKEIAFLDLHPYFKKEFEHTKEALYWDSDYHLNVKGHELTAKMLYSKLKELGWLKR